MTFETIEVEKEDGLAVVRLNRPQRLNAWTPQMGAELLAAVRALAEEMRHCAPLSLHLTRQALYQGLRATFEAQVRFEGFTLDYLYRTHDHAAAVRAFREKRAPEFSGAVIAAAAEVAMGTAPHPAIASRQGPRTHAYVRDVFLRVLGAIFLIAFLSLWSQLMVLMGSGGLLPACPFVRLAGGVLQAPTIFQFYCSDTALHVAAGLGAGLSVVLMLNCAPRYVLAALLILYLSFVTVGQDFFSFQWDNLLLESAFFALFITPAGLRPRRAPPPHPIAVFLMLWLLLRLQVESGAAKLLSGDPTWRNLSAMVSYYETAPLPTWVGWYVHQLPRWAHQLTALSTLVVELAVAPWIWGPRVMRPLVAAVLVVFQLVVLASANYGFFNYLSIALCLFVLDDGHLEAAARRCGWKLTPVPSRPPGAWRTALFAACAAMLLPISVIPFAPFLRPIGPQLLPIRRLLNNLRIVNAYHLFAQMTLVRREAIIEGSDDGVEWRPYEFHYKPGDPQRAPAFVAPHQPRVDFQMWFLLLGDRRQRYFDALIEQLLTAPQVVAPLFVRDPFGGRPPAQVRIAVYRYTFTDAATRRGTGAWWNRELLGHSSPITAGMALR